MNVAKIQDLSEAFANVLLSVLTFSYSGAYAYHTVDPIENIKDHQQYEDDRLKKKLINALVHFRNLKSEELSFVTKAVSQDRFSTHRYSGYRKLSYTTRIGYLIWSSGGRCLLMAYSGNDSVGC
jgi:hypothetical protein